MPTDELMFDFTAAAAATGKSRVTIHRYLNQGKFPHAVQVLTGRVPKWMVPASDLLAAGLKLLPASPGLEPDDERTVALKIALAAAQVLAEERQRTIMMLNQHVEDLQNALLRLVSNR